MGLAIELHVTQRISNEITSNKRLGRKPPLIFLRAIALNLWKVFSWRQILLQFQPTAVLASWSKNKECYMRKQLILPWPLKMRKTDATLWSQADGKVWRKADVENQFFNECRYFPYKEIGNITIDIRDENDRLTLVI